jgi:hypothetical protein
MQAGTVQYSTVRLQHKRNSSCNETATEEALNASRLAEQFRYKVSWV